MFDIISMGEYTLLADAFNGLAMIFNSGPINNMMKVAFLVGILWFGVRAAFFTKWDATPLLAGLIGYMCMFGPKVDVTITDGYSGAVRVVANVPVGIAAPMGITSHTGRYFAATFEQAFAVITPGNGYYTEGYLNSLEVLLKMRAPSLGWSSVATNSKVEATLMNYLKDCVYLDLAMNDPGNAAEVDAIKLTTEKDTWANLKTTFVNVYTTDYINMTGNVPQQLPCNAVYNRLDAQISGAGAGSWIRTYYDNYLQTQMAASRQAFASSAEDRIANALGAINLNSADARTWMMNTMLGTALRNADSAYQVGQNNIAGTVMITQAAAQRNTKWAAEKSMFEQVSRPITAFIEMFMVGAAPIMAFAIAAFGHAGFGILGKFLMMHVWVTLWVPTTALVNAYMNHTMAKYVEWVQYDRGIELLSQAGLDQLNSQLQTQYATGGMLAAAVPMLTLMLIYGSSQVATQLASQMRGSEYIDPKVASPDIVQPGPIATQASSWTQNPSLGTMQRTGAAVPAMDLGAGFQRQASSQWQVASTNAAQAQDGFNKRYGLTESANDQIQVGRDGSVTGTGTFSKGVAAAYNKSLAAGRASGMSAQAAHQYALSGADGYVNATQGSLGVNAGVGVGGPGGAGPSLGVSGGGGKRWESSWSEKEASQYGVTSSQLEEANKRLGVSSSQDESINAGLQYAKANRDTIGKTQGFAKGASVESGRTIGSSLIQTQQSALTATTAESMAQRLGVGAQYHPTQLAADYRGTFGSNWMQQASADFDKSYAHLPPEQAAEAKAAALQAVRQSGLFKNSSMTDAREQAGLEKLWAMALNPAGSQPFIDTMGRVSGMNLNGVAKQDPSTYMSSVPQGALSNKQMLPTAANYQAEAQQTQDMATGRVNSAAARAQSWERTLSSNFSPDAIRQYYQDKVGDVDAQGADWKRMADDMSARWRSDIPGEQERMKKEYLEKTPEQAKADLSRHKEHRGVVANREARQADSEVAERDRNSGLPPYVAP